MDKDYEVLEKSSGLLFTVGAFFSKLQYVPMTVVRVGSNVTALLMYLAGYVLWIAACQKYPDEKGVNHHWYTFAEFKAQFTASAIIGSIAMGCSLLAIINPTAFVISAWLMVVSNFLWVVGEGNKMENPPHYRQLPDTKHQQTNFNYTTIVFTISVVTALSVTGVIFFPAAAVYIVSLASILTTGLSLWSFEHLLENWFSTPKNSDIKEESNIPEVNPALAKMQPDKTPKNENSYTPHSELARRPTPNQLPILSSTTGTDSMTANPTANFCC
ncbi:hypothetical protein [Legionella sp. W05-934-2]|jgi:hypothetical protein|uniref:hypothetical protein n=1 Tax=Legionella sp. W05-934-2 TaxID=1198649 RepID=UPI0034635D2A